MNSRKTDSLPAAKSAGFLSRWRPPESAFALLMNSRKTDPLPTAKSAGFLVRLAPPESAFALLMNSRKADSLPAAKSAGFLSRWALPESAFALLMNSRKADSLPTAKSAGFLSRWRPPESAFALLMKRLCLIGVLLGATACRRNEPPEVFVAAAANLTEVFQHLGPIFEKQTGIHPVFSFASTAQLARQIENGAPFDVIAAADAQHVEELDRKGLLLAGSLVPYATGVLCVWIPPGRTAVASIHDLISPKIRVVAIAKPELSPYGHAAVETLHRVGIWDQVEPKIVYAENIRMAKQYGATGNADAVFTAYSLVLKEAGTVMPVDENLHEPIVQELGITAKTQHLDAARRFAAFLLGSEGRAVLRRFGYKTRDL